MRHFVLLTIATLIFATLTWLAWEHDQSRQQAKHAEVELQISQDALALEQQYLSHARTLIALLDPQDSLLAEIDATRTVLTDMSSLVEREPRFQDLVARIRARLLRSPDPAQSDALLQEWRRLTDQMNGALHRRNLLLEKSEDR